MALGVQWLLKADDKNVANRSNGLFFLLKMSPEQILGCTCPAGGAAGSGSGEVKRPPWAGWSCPPGRGCRGSGARDAGRPPENSSSSHNGGTCRWTAAPTPGCNRNQLGICTGKVADPLHFPDTADQDLKQQIRIRILTKCKAAQFFHILGPLHSPFKETLSKVTISGKAFHC